MSHSQTTSEVMMIRPVRFRYNEETAVNNYYQNKDGASSLSDASKQAALEFDALVNKLKEEGVFVHVFDDIDENNTPDSIFPNNWISFHDDGTLGLYPMNAINRRRERRKDIIEKLSEKFLINRVIDYSVNENYDRFLEGTGSMVLDRINKIAYAVISPRTNPIVFSLFCQDFGYKPVLFNSFQTVDNQRLAVYHTNVIMCMADTFCVICLDSVDNKDEREKVRIIIEESGKEVIEISENQMNHFAGNMLQLKASNGKNILVMSTQAFENLDKSQIEQIENHSKIVHSDIKTIETCGGGSARCMIAEVFLPKR